MPSTFAGYILATSGNDTWAEYTNADMASAVGALPSEFHDRAMWLCHPIAYGLTMCRLAATAGGPQTIEVNGKTMRAFMGYPVVLSSAMQRGTAATDLSNLVSFAFGDFSRAGMLGDRRNGVNVFSSDQRYLEYDQMAWRATERFDVVWQGLGDASAAGAVVALVGN